MSPKFALPLGFAAAALYAADQPQWGRAWDRNMVSAETGLADGFDPATGRNIRWTAATGSESYGSPVVANGRVYISANNAEPRDPNRSGDRGVLFCFSERDGHLLWQLAVPKRTEDPYYDWPKTGWSSPVTVESDRVYTVSNRGEVLCLDPEGMANGNDGPFKEEAAMLTRPGEAVSPVGPLDGDVIWRFDLCKEAGVWPHDGAHSSILILGEFLYLNSGTGVDNTHKVIRTPDAPSLVVLNKRTGEYVARDQEGIAPRIFHCTWSSPTLVRRNGRDVIVHAAGDGVLYGYEPLPAGAAPGDRKPLTLKRLWRVPFDTNAPAGDIHPYLQNRAEGPSNIYGMPVWDGEHLFVSGGGDHFWGKNEAWTRAYHFPAGGPAEPPVAEWSTPLFHHTMTTAAVADGLVYVTDTPKHLRCLDAKTGHEVWVQDLSGEVWSSPLVADGKVFVGDRSGDLWVMAAGPEKRVISKTSLHEAVSGTVTAANGALYISTAARLFSVGVPLR
jgi:outer membrane protein assembly factor BamB